MAAPRPQRSGERALLVTEQLALQQTLGQRRTVHRDERRPRSRALRVDRPRQPLLPYARLAQNEQRRVRRRHPGRQRQQVLHRQAVRHEVAQTVTQLRLLGPNTASQHLLPPAHQRAERLLELLVRQAQVDHRYHPRRQQRRPILRILLLRQHDQLRTIRQATKRIENLCRRPAQRRTRGNHQVATLGADPPPEVSRPIQRSHQGIGAAQRANQPPTQRRLGDNEHTYEHSAILFCSGSIIPIFSEVYSRIELPAVLRFLGWQ